MSTTPYPIATLADGRIKYSDGSIRGVSKLASYQPNATSALTGKPVYVQSQSQYTPYQTPTAGTQAPATVKATYNSPQMAQSAGPSQEELQAQRQASANNFSKNYGNTFSNFLSQIGSSFTKPAYASDRTPSLMAPKFYSNPLGSEAQSANRTDWSNFMSGLKNMDFGKVARSGAGIVGGALLPIDLGVSEGNFFGGKSLSSGYTANSSRAQGTSGFNNTPLANKSVMDQTQRDQIVNDYNNNLPNWQDAVNKANTTYNPSGDLFEVFGNQAGSGYDNGLKSIIDAITNGSMDEASAAQAQRDLYMKQMDAYYNNVKGDAQSTINDYNTQYDQSKNRLTNNLNDLKSDATTQKTQATNIYGDMIRRNTKNNMLRENDLRNVFSQAGSANSSAFMDKLAQLNQTSDEYNADTERTMADKLTGIDTIATRAERDINDQITALDQDKQAKIADIQRNMNYTDQERALKIEQINTDFTNAVRTAKQNMQYQLGQLATLQQQLAANRGDILTKGALDQSLLDRQNQYEMLMAQYMPQLQQSYNGYVGTSSKNKTLADPYQEFLSMFNK